MVLFLVVDANVRRYFLGMYLGVFDANIRRVVMVTCCHGDVPCG